MSDFAYSNYPVGVGLLPGEEADAPDACECCGADEPTRCDGEAPSAWLWLCERCAENRQAMRDYPDVAALVQAVTRYAVANGFVASLLDALQHFPEVMRES